MALWEGPGPCGRGLGSGGGAWALGEGPGLCGRGSTRPCGRGLGPGGGAWALGEGLPSMYVIIYGLMEFSR